MTGELILLIDLWTQSLRAAVLNRIGTRVFSKSLPVSTRRQGMCQEQDPMEWRAGMLGLLAAVGAEKDLAGCIRAIAACGTLGGMVAVDTHSRPLRPALLYSDQRASAYTDVIEATAYFREPQRQTGWRVFCGDLLPQVLRLSRQEPDVYARAQVVLDSTGYLNPVLTGRSSLESYSMYSCYSRPGSADVPAGLMRELGLDPAQFGPAVASGDELGTLSPEIASQVGLPQCSVISLPYDSMTAYLGAGLCETGDALDISGTVTSFGVLHPAQVIDRERRIHSFPLPANSKWLVRGQGLLPAVRWSGPSASSWGMDLGHLTNW